MFFVFILLLLHSRDDAEFKLIRPTDKNQLNIDCIDPNKYSLNRTN